MIDLISIGRLHSSGGGGEEEQGALDSGLNIINTINSISESSNGVKNVAAIFSLLLFVYHTIRHIYIWRWRLSPRINKSVV